MNDYVNRWHNLILNCSFDNTYKMVWGKALVELSLNVSEDYDKDIVVFEFKDIAELCLKYYWNQIIYFDLIQSANLKKPPEIVCITKLLINEFFIKRGSVQPIRFEKINFDSIGLTNNYFVSIKRIIKTLKQDVCWRFMNLNSNTYEIYKLDRDEGKVYFTKQDALSLKIHSDFLFTVINYRWTQILEGFNYSPRISRKVRAIDEDKISRSSLKKFHKHIDLLFKDGNRKCFYCGEKIFENELSVDHVIPWSYMFSDDLWNLVYCHKGENSEKSNRMPLEQDIKSLEERNKALLKVLDRKSKEYDQLQIAIEKDYLKQFWISFKG
ncbi:HNH endonuclease domain-containing protein [Bacillus sp. AFS053548]|uniref:HNH endonuclease domain-containing protein n=1 Tax=Bacillus sp. AFS053548 TaxID=2033505 RepID=UPI000BFB42EE|nr:HNH endonuclease domain-containing protein [Bacillus sp. AFS053548]PGM56988.1 HNH endonuclease [Bacillus sp. AFS053548]